MVNAEYCLVDGIPAEIFKSEIPYVCLCRNYRTAIQKFDEYIENNKEQIIRAFRQNGRLEIWNRDCKVILFMDEYMFGTWCKGRTYHHLERPFELYHSGRIYKEMNYEDNN